MTTTDVPTTDLRSLQRQLVERLDAFRRVVRRRLVLAGAVRVLAEAVVLAALSLLLDRWLRLGLGMRLALLVIGAVALVLELWRHVITPLRLRLSPVALAAALDARPASNRNGKRNGNGHRRAPLAPRVASVLELPRLLNQTGPTSQAMVRTAVLRSHEQLSAVDFNEYLDPARLQRARVAGAALLLAPILFAIVAPSTASLWARRWFFGSNQPWPQRTHLAVAGLHDGRLIVPRGEPAVLRVSLRENSTDPQSVRLRIRPDRGAKTDATMTRFGPGDYRFDLPPLQSPVRLELTGG